MRKRMLAVILALAPAAMLSACSTAVFRSADAGVTIMDDRRTLSAYVADEAIEIKASSAFADAAPGSSRAVFTSFNRRALITGQVPDEATKAKAEEIARKHPEVREVFNELVVGESVSIVRRTQDGFLTTKIKARLLDDDRIGANHVEVVTENGVVYLMGMLKQAEAQAAAEIAARTQGVARVVKVFEYIE